MIKNWLLYLLALAGVLVFHTFYFGWYSWFLLVLTVCLPLFSLLVSILAMVRIRLSLDAPLACHRGDSVYVSLRAQNGFLPMPRCRFRLVVRACMTGKELRTKQEPLGQELLYVPLDTTHVGVLQCRLEKARVYDYLGLFYFPVRRPPAAEVQVNPRPTQPDKLPNLSHFLARQRRPKPGGGFSEEHEMRDYRPGDSMRDIHWKLSVKTDRTIVREAQEPIRGSTLLTFDLRGTQTQTDHLLEQLLWLSRWLLEHDTPHQFIWFDPEVQQLTTQDVETAADQQAVLTRLLHTPVRDDTPTIAHRKFPTATWRCHLEPEG